MTELPNKFASYLNPARQLLKEGAVKDMEFSGATYQVLVQEEEDKPGVWAFMQLDDRGDVKDCFCGCDEGDANGACRHLTAAYLKIFDRRAAPLHVRFQDSVWHRLCSHYAEKAGYDAEQLKRTSDGAYQFQSISGKLLFSVKGIGKAGKTHLHDLLETRTQQTEETSLKFSNLSQTEIQLWREGRPSLELLYHLSFWNDLAKWMMVLQENDPSYNMVFSYSSNGTPNTLQVTFSELAAFFYIPEALLSTLIPALAHTHSPIPVRDFAKEAVEAITYDEAAACLKVERVSRRKQEKLKELPEQMSTSDAVMRFGEWSYTKAVGFFHTAGSLLAQDTISGDAIAILFRDHYFFLREKLKNVDLHDEPVEVAYHLCFDAEWNLHIRPYLFNVGDLQKPRSHVFGDWAYLEGDGFYRLKNIRNDSGEEIIPSHQVSDFITQHRIWLSSQEGFSPHLAMVEADLSYTIDATGNLSFSSAISPEEGSEEQKDFGRWVYILGQGFFAKVGTHIGLPVRPGAIVQAETVGLFIHMNQDELRFVPHFFSDVCPISRSELSVELTNDHDIIVTPRYEIMEPYRDKALRFYGDYVYTPGEGFFRLPHESTLPRDYSGPVRIEPTGQTLFLHYEMERLKPFIGYLDPRLTPPKQLHLMAEDIVEANDGRGWYDLKLSYVTDKGAIPLGQLWRAIAAKEPFLYSSAGLIDLSDLRFGWLHSLNKRRIDLRSNTVTLSTMELIRLNIFDEIKPTTKRGEKAEGVRRLLLELTTFQDPEEPDVSGLNSSLRPYQEIGIRWLWFLYHHGLSGMLCDDMGLGKTHQSMALMAAIKTDFDKRGMEPGPKFLVICPTSVLYHWQEKLMDFLPGLSVHTFYGLERSLDAFTDDCSILLTSYGIWRREVHRLKEIKFDLAIFDEIQAAKSQASRLHQSLQEANATMRLGLTGTPIENRLIELKALFDIVLPTYMPGERDYREFFVKPIEKEGDQTRRHLLTRLVKPFLLRRKKEDVLTDLPEKTEEVFHCQLSPEQRKLYVEVLEQGRSRLVEELRDTTKAVPYVHIFAILTQLKRICNHPAVYLNTPQDYQRYQSGKWDLFVELLSEARDSGQKVVVFSQYLAMLDIFQEYLSSEGIAYASIRGSTANRGEELRRFNQDPACEVFLGSLQAVGLGVDLTAASVVIHYDRWWNAARENQATDRVHRIGQTRGVQVFKLVTKGTFEERIDALIASKGRLMEEVIGVDDQDVVKRLDRDELIQLLQYVDEAASDNSE